MLKNFNVQIVKKFLERNVIKKPMKKNVRKRNQKKRNFTQQAFKKIKNQIKEKLTGKNLKFHHPVLNFRENYKLLIWKSALQTLLNLKLLKNLKN